MQLPPLRRDTSNSHSKEDSVASESDASMSSVKSNNTADDDKSLDILKYDTSLDKLDDDDDIEKSDLEVSKYSFFHQLFHYMEGVPVSEDNRKAVELAIMVEAGTAVREMPTMTKEMRSKCFHREF